MDCTCTPFIYVVNANGGSVDSGGNIPLGSIVHQMCDECSLKGDGIVCRGHRVYDVEVAVSLSVPSAQDSATRDAIISLQQDSVDVPGGIATSTLSSATQTVTLGIYSIVRNDTKTSSVLTLNNKTVAPISISNLAFTVKPLRS